MGECSRGIEAPLELPLGRGLCVRASSMPRLAVESQVHTSSMTRPLCWILRTFSGCMGSNAKVPCSFTCTRCREYKTVEFQLVFCSFGSVIKAQRIVKMGCDLWMPMPHFLTLISFISRIEETKPNKSIRMYCFCFFLHWLKHVSFFF